MTVDQINMNDLNPRIASAIETKAGPDIIMMISNWPHLYADGLADVDDLAEEIAKRDGAYYEHNKMVSVVGPTPYWEKHSLWERDPKLAPFKESVKYGRWPGYPGPPSRKASEALVKYILVDMYAQAIKGLKPEDAAKWAE